MRSEKEEQQGKSEVELDGSVAKDLARLYTWANVEEVAYQDFTKQRAERRLLTMRAAEELRRAVLEASRNMDGNSLAALPGEDTPSAILAREVAEDAYLTPPAPLVVEETFVPHVSIASSPVAPLSSQTSAPMLASASAPVTASREDKITPPLHASDLGLSQTGAVPALQAVAAHEPLQASVSAPAAEPQKAAAQVVPGQALASLDKWFATPVLRGSQQRQGETRVAVAIYSIAGGVGKSTLCANLSRALCGLGERILLVDGSGFGLLPLHFGANDLRPGLRSFRAPGEQHPSLQVLSAETIDTAWLHGEVATAMARAERTIFDLSAASENILEEVLTQCNVMLVPLLPDLNSILTISRIADRMDRLAVEGKRQPEVFYILNKFDASRALDQQAQELVMQQCGDRLLPFSIRAGDEATEALSNRMTVGDLSPGSGLSRDYSDLAKWLRHVSPPGTLGLPGRWSEL